MSAGNTISVTMGVDLTPLRKDFAEAKTMAAKAGQDVQKAMSSSMQNARPINWRNVMPKVDIDQYARQAQQRRFAGNYGAFYPPAPAGKYPSPAEEEEKVNRAGRRSLFRAASQFRTLIGMIGLQQIVSAVEEASAALSERRAKISTLTSSSGLFRSEGDVSSNLSGITDQLAELRKERAVRHANWFNSSVTAVGDMVTGDSDQERQEATQALRKQASQDIDAMARKQENLNDAERAGLSGNHKRAALLREEAKWMTNIYELAKAEAQTGIDNASARTAETARHKLALQAIDRDANELGISRADRRQSGVEISRRGIGLTPAQQRIANLRDRLRLQNSELSLGGDPDKLAQLGLARDTTKADLRQSQFDLANTPWQERRAARIQAQRFRQFSSGMDKSEMGPSLYHAYGFKSTQDVGDTKGTSGSKESGNPIEALASIASNIVSELQKLNDG